MAHHRRSKLVAEMQTYYRVRDHGGEGPVIGVRRQRQRAPGRGDVPGLLPGGPQARGIIQAEFSQRPGQRPDHRRAVHALHAEPRQMPARHHHPGQSTAAMRTPVVTRHDHLMTPVTPLGRQHPHLRARREMPRPGAHFQAALARGGFLRDVGHDAERSQLSRAISHRPIIGTSSLCVPKTSSTSCDQVIFVDQATDARLSSDAVLTEIDRLGERLQRRGAAHRAVRPMLIVVDLVLA